MNLDFNTQIVLFVLVISALAEFVTSALKLIGKETDKLDLISVFLLFPVMKTTVIWALISVLHYIPLETASPVVVAGVAVVSQAVQAGLMILITLALSQIIIRYIKHTMNKSDKI